MQAANIYSTALRMEVTAKFSRDGLEDLCFKNTFRKIPAKMYDKFTSSLKDMLSVRDAIDEAIEEGEL